MAHGAEQQRASTDPRPDAHPRLADALHDAHLEAPVGVAIRDHEGRFVFVNETMARMLGRPADAISRRAFGAVTHPDDRMHLRARWEALQRGDVDTYDCETRFLHDDGTIVWAHVHARAHRDACGHLVLAVIHAQDVGDQKRFEEALASSEARTDALLRHAREVVMIVDPSGSIRYASPAVEEVLGFDAAIFDETHPFDLLHPDDRATWLDGWQHVSGQSADRFSVTTRILHADGSYRWCEATLRDLTSEPGVDGYLAHFQDVTEKRRAEDSLAARALHDGLTGLANRALLVDRLRHALDRAERSGSVVALLFCDLDRFKPINDSFGHATGDAVLREVATRLQAVVRPADTVARLGGDEFVVCCEDVVGGTEAVLLAERILTALRAPFAIDARQISISTSVGIAVAGRGAEDPDAMLRSADAAMYAAKANGRDRYEVFDDGIRARLRHRMEIEDGVRRALEADELRLHYQPIFALPGADEPRRVVGVEALVRWLHPDRGLLRPVEFLAIAAQSGAAGRVTEWVIDDACRQVACWREHDLEVPTVWVNISADQLTQPTIVSTVAAALARHGLPGRALGFDVAEPMLQTLAATPGGGDALEALAGLGCSLALDDFGTGATSLRAVRRFGLTMLKLDPSLWRDPSDGSLLEQAVGFGRLTGLTVVAEAIEDEQQLAALRAVGCDCVTGDHLAPPAPAEVVAELFAR